jgi:hypothetical protein
MKAAFPHPPPARSHASPSVQKGLPIRVIKHNRLTRFYEVGFSKSDRLPEAPKTQKPRRSQAARAHQPIETKLAGMDRSPRPLLSELYSSPSRKPARRPTRRRVGSTSRRPNRPTLAAQPPGPKDHPSAARCFRSQKSEIRHRLLRS